MAITKNVQPDSFFVRFEDGVMKGWHLTTLTTYTENGITSKPELSDAMNVAQATAAGFSLTALVSKINADALTQLDAAKTQVEDLTASLADATAALNAADAKSTAEKVA